MTSMPKAGCSTRPVELVYYDDQSNHSTVPGIYTKLISVYMRSHTFATVVGDIAFGSDAEWAKSRTFFTQFQNVAPNDVEQFRDGAKQVILWPPEFKTGNIMYPYAKARRAD
jgi:hypothetical protein